ncbi:MAG TPA: DUF1801 domain-containing protein [Gemmatimonadaceae bacterium]|nr:DUF1801 domain-containing protein [Gemmatimonadaceae bacterium]
MASSSAARSVTPAGPKVRAYLASLPPDARKRLKEIRSIIRAIAPKATEVFSYGIPGFRLNDKPLVWYAAFKNHISLYPMSAALRRTHARELEGLKMSTGTIQFPLSERLPSGLVKRLIKGRMAELR